MYLKFLVDIPNVPGKITYRRKADTDYVYYEYDRKYDILDRGYFSRQNLEAIREKGYSYLIMVKGMAVHRHYTS